MNELLSARPELKDRIIPYIGGEEINAAVNGEISRYAIYLSDVQSEAELPDFEPLSAIVESRVKPERMRLGDNPNNTP